IVLRSIYVLLRLKGFIPTVTPAPSSFDKILSPEETVFSYVTVKFWLPSILIKVWQCLFYRKLQKQLHHPH
ncbi:MAG: hypothetical protein ACLTE2_08665, partial [Eubacteriales bacterium]